MAVGNGARSAAESRRGLWRRARGLEITVAICAVVFIGLALLVSDLAEPTIDIEITRAIQQIDSPAMFWLMIVVSAFGYPPWNVLLFVAAVGGLWLRGFRREAGYSILSLGAGIISAAVKLLVNRDRPTGDLVLVVTQQLDFSYPSGHVTTYVSFFGFLFFLFYILFHPALWRTVMLWALAVLIALIGLSRVYLGNHWASDVLGGYALGSVYLVALIQIYRSRRPPPDEQPTGDAE